MSDFNPYEALGFNMLERARAENDARLARYTATRAALGHPAGRAWLQARLAEELARPSYEPGLPADQVAFREGRKDLLRELEREISTPIHQD